MGCVEPQHLPRSHAQNAGTAADCYRGHGHREDRENAGSPARAGG